MHEAILLIHLLIGSTVSVFLRAIKLDVTDKRLSKAFKVHFLVQHLTISIHVYLGMLPRDSTIEGPAGSLSILLNASHSGPANAWLISPVLLWG